MKQTHYERPGFSLRSGTWIWLLLLVVSGCATTPPGTLYETRDDLRTRLNGDVRTLRTVRPHLEALDDDFATLRRQGNWIKRGYFSVAENDRMEHLLFRFHASHSALWDISAAYQNMRTAFDDPVLNAKAHVVSRQASLLLATHSALLVERFAGDPVAIAKMNEAFYRSEIPRDSYYVLERELTAERLSRLKQSGGIASKALSNPDSALAKLAVADASYRELIELNKTLQIATETRMQAALETRGSVAPEAVRKTDELFDSALYTSRSLLFKDVSRLKSPTARLIRFSDAQKAQVLEQLRPGDLILTYTAGYISDVFIPGAFKHGITYVGSPEQRVQAGLIPPFPAAVPDARDRLETHVALANLNNGKPADMIEAVAEGVIFNNLAHIMDTHINRMLVLRPQLTAAERTAFLVEIFSYLGEDYDFHFDFSDSTRQVCTEVIYRGIQDKGGITFELTVRAGHETLSADDVVLYYLDRHPGAFQLVLYAEENPAAKNHGARILTGKDGIRRLRELMQSVDE